MSSDSERLDNLTAQSQDINRRGAVASVCLEVKGRFLARLEELQAQNTRLNSEIAAVESAAIEDVRRLADLKNRQLAGLAEVFILTRLCESMGENFHAEVAAQLKVAEESAEKEAAAAVN